MLTSQFCRARRAAYGKGAAHRFGWLSLVLIALASAATSRASLVLEGTALSNGGGIGTSSVILTIQNTGTEQGCVGWNGSIDIVGSAACPVGLTPSIIGGDEKSGNSQVQTLTIAQTGVLSAASLVVILNVNEPGGGSFTVNNVSLTIYGATTGQILFNSGNLTNPTTISDSFQGQGNPGFAFMLDATEAAEAQAFWSNPLNRVGIAGLLSQTAGSNETFSVADGSVVNITPLPEPSGILLSLAGLAGIALLRRRKS